VSIVLDDDEVLSDEDAPLQKRLWLSSAISGSSGSAPATAIVAAVVKAGVDKEVTDKRATEEAVVKEAADKVVTDKRAAMKEVAVEAARDSSAPGQVPSSAVGAKRATTPSGSTLPAKRPYWGILKHGFL
jgi:hypothetical protein